MATSKLVTGIIATIAVVGAGAAILHLNPELTKELRISAESLFGKKPLGSYTGDTVTGREWMDSATLQTRLATTINQRLHGTDAASVEAFMRNPENLLLLAQWQLASHDLSSIPEAAKKKANYENELTKLRERQAQLKESRKGDRFNAIQQAEWDKLSKQIDDKREQISYLFSLKDYVQDSPTQEEMEEITNNLDWMQQILYSGECSQPARVFQLISAMLKAHPESAYNQVERDIITATALEFAQNGWKTETALDRADYFITSWRANRLHTKFDALPLWQRRIVCGCKGDNNFCTRAALEWSLDHVHLPADKYPGSCWRNGYKLYNLYGEIIHGPGYGEPFAGLYEGNAMLFTNKVGGVCGNLSHFGAYSACANGVPAATSGEPAHCSFFVLIDGNWTPAYSLTWERSLHWTPWEGTHGFSSLEMADQLYSQEQSAKTSLSNTYLSLANMFASQGTSGRKKAKACYRQAIDCQPLNYPAWRSYAQFIQDLDGGQRSSWRTLNKLVCQKLALSMPEMAADILTKHVYPQLAEGSQSPEQLMQDFNVLWQSVKGMGIERWNVEKMLDTQLNYFKENGKLTDQKKVEVYAAVIKSIINNGTYAPVVLAWGSEMAAKMSPDSQKQLLDATVKTLAGSKSVDSQDRDKMLASAIINTEQTRDRQAFQSISRMLSQSYTNPQNKQPKFDPFPGQLMSQDGLLFLSSSSKQHDDPCAHPGVLRPEGGRFHTNKDAEAWAAVELSRLVEISGVVVVATPGNFSRLHGMRIQVSESGRDGEWKDVGSPVENVTQRVNRYDLTAEKPRARFIRVLRPAPADFFHLSGIYVYGTPAS